MAVKKATSRTRSATKESKTTRSTTKRATKTKSATRTAPEPAQYTPTVERPEFTQPEAAAAAAAAATATGEQPSRFTGDHFLHVKGPEAAAGTPRRPGKWLIFVSRSRIDGLWDEVRRAVERGRLGHAAKVSTALPNPMSPDPKKHMICVYTGNEDDPTDVRRVRDALRQLGINWKIPYKSDAAEGSAAKYYE
jgi:Bles03-like protein